MMRFFRRKLFRPLPSPPALTPELEHEIRGWVQRHPEQMIALYLGAVLAALTETRGQLRACADAHAERDAEAAGRPVVPPVAGAVYRHRRLMIAGVADDQGCIEWGGRDVYRPEDWEPIP